MEQLHRPTRHMHLKAMAEEMEAQAATWQLVFCLHCDEAAPAGDGGRAVLDAGGAQLYRHRVADCISAEPEMARCSTMAPPLYGLCRAAQGHVCAVCPCTCTWA